MALPKRLRSRKRKPETTSPKVNIDNDDEINSINGHVKTYKSLYIDLTHESGNEYKGDCPFCKGSSLHINNSTGQFHCKTCDKQGNKYTFMQFYYDYWLERTSVKQLDQIAKDRRLPPEAFQQADIAFDKSTGLFLIPLINAKGSMVNIGKWNINGKEARPVMMLAGCKTHLFNLHNLGKARTIILCEGPWDQIAMDYLLLENREKGVTTLAVPGASTFKEEWCQHFEGKNVILAYDNDDAGRKGSERVASTLTKNVKLASLSKIFWPESYPDKYDLRDYVVKHNHNPVKALENFYKLTQEVSRTKELTLETNCKTFQEIIEHSRSFVHMDKAVEDGLMMVISIILSSKIFEGSPYCPLWMFFVAPSGSGKSMCLESTKNLDEISWHNSLTPKTLVSGFKGDKGEDHSLLATIPGKTLLIEDFTSIMNLPAGDQDEIYGVLRTVYSGKYEKTFGHIGKRVYPDPSSGHETCHFAMVAASTGAIHADRRAHHGERFVKFQLFEGDVPDEEERINAAIDGAMQGKPPEVLLRDPVTSFVRNRLEEIESIPPEKRILPITPDTKKNITKLARIVSAIRAVIIRKGAELLTRPEKEVATRIAVQLAKVGQAVAWTLGEPEVNENVLPYIRRVALDTCFGFHRDILFTIAKHHPEGILMGDIVIEAAIKRATADRIVEDLLELKAIYATKAPGNSKGRRANLWHVSDNIYKLLEETKVLEEKIIPTNEAMPLLIDDPKEAKIRRKRADNPTPPKQSRRRKKPSED